MVRRVLCAKDAKSSVIPADPIGAGVSLKSYRGGDIGISRSSTGGANEETPGRNPLLTQRHLCQHHAPGVKVGGEGIMQLRKASKRTVAALAATAIMTSSLAAPAVAVNRDAVARKSEGGVVTKAHYQPNRDRTLCKVMGRPTARAQRTGKPQTWEFVLRGRASEKRCYYYWEKHIYPKWRSWG